MSLGEFGQGTTGMAEKRYVTIRIPRQLSDEIDRLIRSGKYRSRAEFTREAVRLRLDMIRKWRGEVEQDK